MLDRAATLFAFVNNTPRANNHESSASLTGRLVPTSGSNEAKIQLSNRNKKGSGRGNSRGDYLSEWYSKANDDAPLFFHYTYCRSLLRAAPTDFTEQLVVATTSDDETTKNPRGKKKPKHVSTAPLLTSKRSIIHV
jgi:hypothetical protein